MLSPAKALGALTSGVPLLMMAAYDLDNAKHHRLGLPEDNLAAIFLIIAGGVCFISLTLTLLITTMGYLAPKSCSWKLISSTHTHQS